MTKQYHKQPEYRYKQQRSHATKRDIPWHFTFETWIDVWDESGKWDEMGNKKHQYVMARYGDVGPYSPENVRIITATDNHKEALENNPHTCISKQDKQPRKYIEPWNKGKKVPFVKHNNPFRKIITPEMVFDNMNDAAEYYGKHPETIRNRLGKKPGWQYA